MLFAISFIWLWSLWFFHSPFLVCNWISIWLAWDRHSAYLRAFSFEIEVYSYNVPLNIPLGYFIYFNTLWSTSNSAQKNFDCPSRFVHDSLVFLKTLISKYVWITPISFNYLVCIYFHCCQKPCLIYFQFFNIWGLLQANICTSTKTAVCVSEK